MELLVLLSARRIHLALLKARKGSVPVQWPAKLPLISGFLCMERPGIFLLSLRITNDRLVYHSVTPNIVFANNLKFINQVERTSARVPSRARAQTTRSEITHKPLGYARPTTLLTYKRGNVPLVIVF